MFGIKKNNNDEKLHLQKQLNKGLAVYSLVVGLPKICRKYLLRQIIRSAMTKAEMLSRETVRDHYTTAMALIGENDKLSERDEVAPWFFYEKTDSLILNNAGIEGVRNPVFLTRFNDILLETLADSNTADEASVVHPNIFHKVLFCRIPEVIFADFRYTQLFYDWYCEGTILIDIFDVIFRGESSEISMNMLSKLRSECKSNQYLYDQVGQVFDKYKECVLTAIDKGALLGTRPRQVNLIKNGSVDALPEFKEKYKSYTNQIYNVLVENGCINCDLTAFISVFSGMDSTTNPIEWKKNPGYARYLLYDFIEWNGKCSSFKDLCYLATKVFMRKGKNFSFHTLYEENPSNKLICSKIESEIAKFKERYGK